VSRLAAALARLASVGRHGRGMALVGGLAVSARAEPRLTRDVEVAVAVAGDAEAEPLMQALVAELFFASSGIEAIVVAEAERLG